MLNNYKYGIVPEDLKKVRKYIINDINSNHVVINPIYNMTLQDYFDVIKQCMLGLIDENGIIKDRFNTTWYSQSRKQDIRNLSSIDIARDWMDGRGLFTEHVNGQHHGSNWQDYGTWDNLSWRDQNQWYHEDRLNDPNWFKQCVLCGIGSGGHPTENIMIANIHPVMYEEDKWYMVYGYRQNPYGVLKSYLYIRENTNIPLFINDSSKYLTKKQFEKTYF